MRSSWVVALLGACACLLLLLEGFQLAREGSDETPDAQPPQISTSATVAPSPTRPSDPPTPTSEPPEPSVSATPASPAPPAPSNPSDDRRAQLGSLLEAVRVVPHRPNPPGYDRDCSPGSGCVFGTAWNDASSAALSRNGCDTRNDVLRQDLDDIVLREGTNGCVVLSGRLEDPYTGNTITFERGPNSWDVQIDHLIPLAAAWDMGASQWPQQRREAFANDPEFVLLAVDGPTNMSKSDSTPGDWLPPNRDFHCEYGIRYLEASIHWDLPITESDAEALRGAAQLC